MPRPGLGESVRRWLRIGALSLCGGAAGACASAEEQVLTDRAVPAPFRRASPDPLEDTFQYHGLTILQPGASNAATRKAAVARIPLHRLDREERQQAEVVLKGTGLYRRLPTISFESDATVYAYFLENPDVAVATWRAMGISKFQLESDRPSIYTADAGDGSRGLIRVCYATPEDTLIYCEGAFKSPLLPRPIVARSLMRVEAKFERQEDGRILATHHGDVFVDFPSQTVETVARLISPVSYSIADRNFKQLTFYVHMMSVAMARQPGWIEAIGQRMEGVSEERREEFLKLSAAAYVAARQRQAIHAAHALSLEDVLRSLPVAPAVTPASASADESAPK